LLHLKHLLLNSFTNQFSKIKFNFSSTKNLAGILLLHLEAALPSQQDPQYLHENQILVKHFFNTKIIFFTSV